MKIQRIIEWIEGINEFEAKTALIECIEELMLAESIRLGDFCPYWETTGYPLIEGQKVWED